MLASRYDILLHPDARTMECPLKISKGVDVNLWKWLFPDTWSDLRSIGNSPLTRLTIAAPFIPFIFDLFDNVISIPLLWPYLENFRIGWPRPRLMSLYFFYYGLSALGAASVIYSIFCPKLPKAYESALDYVNKEVQTISSIQANIELTNADEFEMYQSIRQSTIAKSMNREYVNADHSRGTARVVVFIFYLIGFVLCSVPVLVKFVGVTRELLASSVLR